jgi:hypothetical protein
MAKILLEFDSVEDREDWEIYSQALKMHAVLHDFLMELRDCTKYQKPTKRDHYWKHRLNEMLLERGVEIV